jgi:hypothetical protein
MSAFGDPIHLIIMIIWCFIEPIRLYYGIAGNMRESVSFDIVVDADLC